MTATLARIEAGTHLTWPGRKCWTVRNELRTELTHFATDASRERIAAAIECLTVKLGGSR